LELFSFSSISIGVLTAGMLMYAVPVYQGAALQRYIDYFLIHSTFFFKKTRAKSNVIGSLCSLSLKLSFLAGSLGLSFSRLPSRRQRVSEIFLVEPSMKRPGA